MLTNMHFQPVEINSIFKTVVLSYRNYWVKKKKRKYIILQNVLFYSQRSFASASKKVGHCKCACECMDYVKMSDVL